jgi:hypothetical protein
MIKITLYVVLFFCALPYGIAKTESKPALKSEPKSSALPTPLPSAIPTPLPPISLQASPLPQVPSISEVPDNHSNNKLKNEKTVEEISTTSVATDSLSKEIELRKQMLDWSRHLGVTCIFCHDTNNFKNDEKAAFKVGLKHKSLVRLLNEEVFTERDKGGTLKVVADCYMCHRGKSTPQFKEPPQNLMK